MSFDPTPEQVNARELFLTGDGLAIEAGAGTGKTSTLALLAEAVPAKRVQFTAFNKAIVVDAGKRFPKNTACNTAHSLAMRAVGRTYRHRLDSPRMRSDEIARVLGIDPLMVTPEEGNTKRLAPGYLAGQVMAAVEAFCQSADLTPTTRHFAYIDGIDIPGAGGARRWDNNQAVRDHLLPALKKAWADLHDPDGRLPYKHGHYLKAWHLSGPRIEADVILADEAQDLNPVLADIVAQQDHAQRVYVGDAAQQLYAWTGAVNALAQVPVDLRAYLTQSFRFGPAVAEQANRMLERLDTRMRIVGFDQIDSRVGPITDPRVILTRTNAAAVQAAFSGLADGKAVHLVGGGSDVISFAKAARDLQGRGETWHRDLACFTSWGEVQTYVEEDGLGSELKLLVKLVDDYGAAEIVRALEGMVPEGRANLVVSTAHKSKGREWPSVQLGGDFPEESGDAPLADAELMLLYVACTRARLALDVTRVAAFQGGPVAPAEAEPITMPY